MSLHRAPNLQISTGDGRELLAIHHDGSVTGSVGDASEAAAVFVREVRRLFALPAVGSERDRVVAAAAWAEGSAMAYWQDRGYGETRSDIPAHLVEELTETWNPYSLTNSVQTDPAAPVQEDPRPGPDDALELFLAGLAAIDTVFVSKVHDHLDGDGEPTARRTVTIDGWVLVDELLAVLLAATPTLAQAWDEGLEAAVANTFDEIRGVDHPVRTNPYRPGIEGGQQ